MRPTHRTPRCLTALALALLCACAGTRKLADPVVEIRSSEGQELGVSTQYGLIFLGRMTRSGPIDVTAWFGDGPSVESTVVEPLGGGLFTAETEIRFPKVGMSFATPAVGTEMLVIGRTGSQRWESPVRVRSHPQAEGLLLTVPADIAERPNAIGAGVYLVDERTREKTLVALVSGHVTIQTADGVQEFLTAIGPEHLWRLLTYRRDYPHKRKFVYREDVL